MMIDVYGLQQKLAEAWRPSIFEQLRAAGLQDADLHLEADRVVKAATYAYAPVVMRGLIAKLRDSIADSPKGLEILLGPEERQEVESRGDWIKRCSNQKAQQREYVDRQVAASLEQLTVDDLDIAI
jgi:hypothetical protein